MEPITTAIIAAVGAGLANVAETAIVDAYNGVKSAIVKRFGADSKLEKAIKNVEDDPESAGYKMNLDDQIAKTGADKDPDVLKAIKQLLDALEKSEGQRKGATGVSLEHIKVAKSAIIDNITSTGDGLIAKDMDIGGDLNISNINAGATNSPK